MGIVKKSALTTFVWYDNEKWKVVSVHQPNEEQTFLFVEQECDEVLEDGTPSVNCIAIDCCNEIWLPDTKRIREIMRIRNDRLEKLNSINAKHIDEMKDIWLSSFKR